MVERYIGNVEVTGPTPVISSETNPLKIADKAISKGFFVIRFTSGYLLFQFRITIPKTQLVLLMDPIHAIVHLVVIINDF